MIDTKSTHQKSHQNTQKSSGRGFTAILDGVKIKTFIDFQEVLSRSIFNACIISPDINISLGIFFLFFPFRKISKLDAGGKDKLTIKWRFYTVISNKNLFQPNQFGKR